MSPRIINELLLILISVFTFVFLKKTITNVASASVNHLEYNLQNFLPDINYGDSEYQKNIEWQSNNKLSMNDLNGAPPENSPLRSEAVISFIYSAEIKNDSLYVTVSSLLDKDKSWINKSSDNNYVLLQHSQAHFDLNELYARKFRAALSKSLINKSKAEEQLSKIYNNVKNEALAKHQSFDLESKHCNDLVAQRRWCNVIHKELRELQPYNQKNVVVALK